MRILTMAGIQKKRRLSRKEQRDLFKQKRKKILCKGSTIRHDNSLVATDAGNVKSDCNCDCESNNTSATNNNIKTSESLSTTTTTTLLTVSHAHESSSTKSSQVAGHSTAPASTSTTTSTASVVTQTDKKHEEYLSNYSPLPVSIPIDDSKPSFTTSTGNMNLSKVSSLGKWFPKAVQLKRKGIDSKTGDTRSCKAAILLFYQYISPLWTQQELQRVQQYIITIGQYRTNLAGRIRIANEGLNVTLSAIDEDININGNGGNTDNNLTCTNSPSYCSDAISTLHYFVQDLYNIDDRFRCTDFKFITDLTADRHFNSYNIIPVQELVYYGFHNDSAHNDGKHTVSKIDYQNTTSGGKHVPPEIFHRLLAGEDVDVTNNDDKTRNKSTSSSLLSQSTVSTKVECNEKGIERTKEIVVIDVRNHYEAILGRFDGQEVAYVGQGAGNQPEVDNSNNVNTKKCVAKYIDPKMRKSTDFPLWVKNNASELIKKDRILLYCTGGIRCERASEHLSSVLENELQQFNATGSSMEKRINSIHNSNATENEFDDSNLDTNQQQFITTVPEIYQLQGGIEKYLQTFKDKDGGFWRGKNFTFDKREAISVHNMNGDGGVLKTVKTKKKKETATNDASNSFDTIPDCKCVICHVFWDRYIGKKKCCTCGVPILVCDNCCSTRQAEISKARCTLCIEEQITIPASKVVYTNNGIQAKVITKSISLADNGDSNGMDDNIPRASNTVLKWGGGHGKNAKIKQRLCKFGMNCNRSDCIFKHPQGHKLH